MVTPKQKNVLQFIYEYYVTNYYPPSVQEIATFLKVACNTVQGHIESLERKKLITKKAGKARSIVVTKEGRKHVETLQ